MADHVAQQLLDAVVTRVTGLTTTGANVFVNHPEDRALQADEIPGLVVNLSDEESIPVTLDGEIIQRTVRLALLIRVKGTGAVDETVTGIRKEVETALAPALTIGSKSVLLDYNGMAEPELDATNDQPMMSARLDFSAILFNSAAAPDVLL